MTCVKGYTGIYIDRSFIVWAERSHCRAVMVDADPEAPQTLVEDTMSSSPYPPTPLRYGAPLRSCDTPLALGLGESFVLLLMFYEVLGERISPFNMMARLVSRYEKWTGKSRHRHVGISLGVRKDNRQIAVLPYDLSCWNSRLSGIGYIASRASTLWREVPKQSAPENCISASDALYVDIDVTMVDLILHNFQLGSGAYVWNRLPQKGIKYPSLWTILRDHLMYLLFYRRTPVKMSRIDEEIDATADEAQCAQYVLVLLVYMLKHDLLCGANEKHKNVIYALVYRKTSVHPHTLWDTLVSTGIFSAVDRKCTVTTLQQFTRNQNTCDETRKLCDIKLANPYDTLIALNEILVWEFKYTHLFPS